MKLIIGLIGNKEAGKSTVTRMIQEFVNADEAALANNLKDASSKVFDVIREAFDRQDMKEVPFVTPLTLSSRQIQAILEEFNVFMTNHEVDAKFANIIGMKLETPRKIAQIVGTEILRAAGDEDIHCKNIKFGVHDVQIVSDIRFPNEYRYFSNVSGVKFLPLFIHRKVAEEKAAKDTHPSEAHVIGMKGQCKVIDNNGGLLETLTQVKKALDEVMIGSKT